MDTERCARFCAMIVCWSAPYPLVGSVTKGYVTWSCASSSCPILSIPIRASVALRLSSENKDDGVEDHEEPGSWQDASDIPVREENEKRSLPPRPTNQHGRHGTQGPGERGRKRLVRSWDSRKKEFVYHEKYDDEGPRKGGNNKKAWNEGWTQDSEQWADSWTGREVRSRWQKSKAAWTLPRCFFIFSLDVSHQKIFKNGQIGLLDFCH